MQKCTITTELTKGVSTLLSLSNYLFIASIHIIICLKTGNVPKLVLSRGKPIFCLGGGLYRANGSNRDCEVRLHQIYVSLAEAGPLMLLA